MRQRHVHPGGRALVLAGALLFSLILVGTALLWSGPEASDARAVETAWVDAAPAEDSALEAGVNPEPAAQSEEAGETGLVVRDREGFVCVYQGDTVYCMTQIPVLSLPAQDREALAEGIPVENEEEMHRILEDFGS